MSLALPKFTLPSKTSSFRMLKLSSTVFLFAVVLNLVGCNPSESESVGSDGQKLTRVTLILNWLPECEHGGFYAADELGIFEKFGLDVTIQPGGPSVMVAPELATGRVQFGIANADDVLMARNEGTKMVALMAPLQKSPRCILTRADSGIDSFEKLKNVTLQINSGRPYVPFLKQKGLLDDSVKVVPYNGGVAQLISGAGFAQQAYSFSEPLLAENEGVEVNQLMMAEIGYNPYACCLVTSDSYLTENEEVVAKMTAACVEGWRAYLEDPTATNARILKENSLGMTEQALEYGVEKLEPLCAGETNSFCAMSQQRWTDLHATLVRIGTIDEDRVRAEEAFTTKFINREK